MVDIRKKIVLQCRAQNFHDTVIRGIGMEDEHTLKFKNDISKLATSKPSSA